MKHTPRQTPRLAGHVHFTGRISNDEAFSRMCVADLVCVPSRPEFTEGFPLTLTEALASRTPVLVSTHPVFTSAFRQRCGVSFFEAGNPTSLADAAQELLQNPALYEQISRESADAFDQVACKLLFGDLLRDWAATFDPADVAMRISGEPLGVCKPPLSETISGP